MSLSVLSFRGILLYIQWDDVVSSIDRSVWLNLIQLLENCGIVTFPRATKPLNTVGQCQLICFFDGSDVAFAAVVYIRWILCDGSVSVTILCAKPRVTPLHRISTPRSELNGALLAARLVFSSVRSLSSSNILPERVWMIGDSECTLASLEKVNAAFGEYFGNRIGEILECQARIEQYCPVGRNGEWWHIDGYNNAAERATRTDCTIIDLQDGSAWRCPPFLLQDPSLWPINREFAKRKEDYIPQLELLKRFRCIVQKTDIEPTAGIVQEVDPYCTNSWEKLVRKTQLLVYAFHTGHFPNIDDVTTIEASKRLWFISSMAATHDAMKAGRLRELDIREIDGMQVICGRASSSLQKFFGKNYLPVLMTPG